ncbi:MAG: M20/M25/M40 family metallo-hydrolase [Phycisphaerae bacterium]
MTAKIDFKEIAEFVGRRARSKEYRDFMVNLLCELIDINTTTSTQPLPQIVANERKTFDVLEQALREFAGPDVTFERSPINPQIAQHPYYTHTYYTADAKHPLGLPVEESYRDRFNLLAIVNPKQKSDNGKPVVLNAHVDTVSPFYPSRVDDKYVHGRGSCDDKGSVVALAAGMKLLTEVQAKFGIIPSQQQVYQFVIEEEPGGNGSLSADLDKRFAGYEAIICEATINVPHPANRGAMWFQMDMDMSSQNVNAAQIVPFIIRELAREGQKLRAETNLPLFPKEYIQVNFGTLNNFGRHPSAVNDFVAYEFTVNGNMTAQIKQAIDAGVAFYCQNYADRTKETNPETNQPKLQQHYNLTESSEGKFKLEIFGVGGHMGAMLLCDNALIKTGYIMQELITQMKKRRDREGVCIEATIEGSYPSKLVMTGGVGFSPSHRMSDLQQRLRAAAVRGIKQFNEISKTNVSETVFNMTFDKLHNEAYASPVDCPAMKAFEAAYRVMNLPWPKPIAFRASCDARIYGNSGYNTITCGPGNLADAHSDHEKISIEELQKGLEIITLTTLSLTTGESA